MYETLNIDENIIQFDCKSRDESFNHSYSIIRQYLPQTNESATVAKFKIFSHLNKGLV